jgi:hypothetical protein
MTVAETQPIYCCDTSSLIHAWRRAYPPKSFKSFWAKLDELINEGRLVSSIEVYAELEKKDDDVFVWAKDRKWMFLEIDDNVQTTMLWVMGKYPRLVDTVKGKSGADPFVIAQALSPNPPLIVLHQEYGGSSRSPKIPYVCDQENLRHIDLLALIEEEGWSF